MDVLELLLHPVRIRILHAFAGDRSCTTADICARLPDVSQATVYRHVALLAEAGVLDVAAERSVRGATERHYRVDRQRALLDQDDIARMSRDDHERAFTAAMAALIADFTAYLDAPAASPTRDRVGYRQIPVWLSDGERDDLVQRVQQLVVRAIRREPQDERRQYLLSPIIFPIAEVAT